MALVYFLLILGVTVLAHEFGHFIFAKKFGIYVYEFSIGMGPKLFGFKRKNDETDYSIRLIPIGGYVKMAGEEVEEDENIPHNQRVQSKSWLQRFITIVAGAVFNFFLAIILLFLIGLVYGSPETEPILGEVQEGYPAFEQGVEEGDKIVSIDGERMATWDDVLMKLELIEEGTDLTFKIQKSTGDYKTVTLTPIKEEIDGEIAYKYGISMTDKNNYGIVNSLKFAFVKFGSIIKSMFQVIANLITGGIGLDSLAGPVGIYNIVDAESQNGFSNVLYLIAFLSVNVGFVNLVPFPAFDGGRVLFLVIEKIKGSKVDPKVENIIHAIGFALLLLLMVIITIQDIKNLF